MITIQGSYAGINTVRNLSLIQRSLNKTMQKLSSGESISADTDGTAEPVISERMRAQIGSLTDQIKRLEFRLNRNSAAGTALEDLASLAGEIRTATQSATDEAVNTPETGKVFQKQINEMVWEFNRRREEATFSNAKLLDGSSGSVAAVPEMPQIEVSTPDQAREAVAEVERIARYVSDAQQQVGEKTKVEYESTMRSLEVASQNLTAAESSILDTSNADEQARYLKAIVQSNVGSAAAAQGQLTSDTVFKLLHA